ncbi:CPXCG motif-containing cysteine-rich protein [Pokkaliibacter plantistimulans]|uniref:CPXCG motif-containing cysteine-rich protein n=1 Tax=Proteobacteria bacterium 228 TaxID=2083153 RepID=A0A2S5KVS8_9PROT|nr:CPXCG motif-containing cysteine-rich protein [Pokkaliibacter plantistimulans]PPC78961.1 CPXCG motif-containing cysteine-rich protein [Pokkaliibacter plantistimulans]
MQALQTQNLYCPYCGEEIDVTVDCSVEEQEYVEDCSVCCSPILLNIVVGDSEQISISASRENG